MSSDDPYYFIITRRDLQSLKDNAKTIYGNEIAEKGILSVVDACEQNPLSRERDTFRLLDSG